ncbi:MAG: glycoside hydrolase family 43 protein [Polyangiaceae bacterium]
MTTFRNPVLPGFYPDPSVCRVGRDFYLVASSFAYFPGVPIFHSRDLVNWRQIGHCLDRASQLPLAGTESWAGVWAPTLRYHRGLFYLATTNMPNGGNFIVTARAPEGPWSEPIPVAQQGIDPSLFFDEDGSVLFTTSHGGALQSQIDVTTGKLLTEPKVIWRGSGGQHPEGPHIYRHQGWYYLLISEGGTEYGHMITMARSQSPWGPFEPCPRNPVLTHRSFQSPIQGVGHAELVDTEDGNWFAACLAFRPNGYPPCYHLGRETYLCPVKWADDGFPVFGNEGRLALEHDTPLSLEAAPVTSIREEFDAPQLAPYWNYLRNPNLEAYSLSERPGHLRLRGAAAGLDDVASTTWVGRRQCQFNARVTTCLEFDATSAREEAGLVVRMNESHHYEVFVTRRNDVASVVVRRRIGSLQAEVACQPLPPDAARVVLAIDAERNKYVFSFGRSEAELTPLAEGETRYLSTEVAGGFTGVYFAMYASGNGAPCRNPADFDWFDYLERDDPPKPA